MPGKLLLLLLWSMCGGQGGTMDRDEIFLRNEYACSPGVWAWPFGRAVYLGATTSTIHILDTLALIDRCRRRLAI